MPKSTLKNSKTSRVFKAKTYPTVCLQIICRKLFHNFSRKSLKLHQNIIRRSSMLLKFAKCPFAYSYAQFAIHLFRLIAHFFFSHSQHLRPTSGLPRKHHRRQRQLPADHPNPAGRHRKSRYLQTGTHHRLAPGNVHQRGRLAGQDPQLLRQQLPWIGRKSVV